MKSVSDIFDAFGGTTAVSRALGVKQSTASEMKRRGSIPAEYWADLVREAAARRLPQITTDLLAELHARHRRQPAQHDIQQIAAPSNNEDAGHFSRFKHLRRSHFSSAEEIDEHVAALRDEWDRQ